MGNRSGAKAAFTPKILVMDDEKRIRDGCHKVLTSEGFEVDRAENGRIGLSMIDQEHFDIVLLDLMMPGLAGLEVLERIKLLHPDTAIIVITGYATVENSIEAMKKGAFDFIPKPFSPEQLRIVVSKALEFTRTLQDIATEKSRMHVMINQLADGVMATDPDKRVVLANPAFLRLLGYTGERVVGRPVSEFIRNDALENMMDRALTSAPDERIELCEEIRLGSKEADQEKILDARCAPFRDRMGRNLGTITVLHDITAMKKMDQLKSDFVTMVSHEIRSPMNTVLMQLNVVLDGLAGELTAKQREILTRTSERVLALVHLASELLDLAKIESGLISQKREAVSIDALLRDQVAFYTPKAERKRIRLSLLPVPKIPSILANKENIEEVFSNLITNAIHYTPEGGSITVSADVENEYLRISVSDTGFGIPREEQDRIFDRFYRVKNEKTRFITGTGLGLPIVKSIVEAHNGTIRVDSEVDKGSTFHVILPLPAS
ncbi:MAG: response regulator [Deltaproteobacteria bacterium]|nr:response regulator [Deltaproteobacteria bacterium]